MVRLGGGWLLCFWGMQHLPAFYCLWTRIYASFVCQARQTLRVYLVKACIAQSTQKGVLVEEGGVEEDGLE